MGITSTSLNEFSANVSVIDTATNTVVATVPVGAIPKLLAFTPDGKHVYVPNRDSGNVSVIDTATNTVVATVWTGFATWVAITPDGKHAYVCGPNTVSVIDTASNTVVATVPVGTDPGSPAITPDGTHAYTANLNSGNVSVIDTTTNTVVATVPVGGQPEGLAITPDGKHAYVPNGGSLFSPNVSVIDTASNTVEATIPEGGGPQAVAITPDGKHSYVIVTNTAVSSTVFRDRHGHYHGGCHGPGGKWLVVVSHHPGWVAYVTNLNSANVSVIDTATNTVVATVPVGKGPLGVGIVPLPPGVPFLAFGANLVIAFGGAPNQDSFALQTSFILSSTTPVINPLTEAVTFQAGTFAVTIPPGSFKVTPQGYFIFVGVINGARLEALIEHTGTLRYAFQAKAVLTSFTGTVNPVPVTLTVGNDTGITSVKALIFH